MWKNARFGTFMPRHIIISPSCLCVDRAIIFFCTANQQQIESQQPSPQQVVEQTASLATSWTTCRTASPRQKSTASCMQQSASLTASRTTCCTTNPVLLIEVMESDAYAARADQIRIGTNLTFCNYTNLIES